MPRGAASWQRWCCTGADARHERAIQQVALIRGINVGRAKRVAMADLRAMMEALGYTDVRTILNSGNVVFTAAEIAVAVAGNVLSGIATNPSRLLVIVLGTPADRARLMPLTRQKWGPEALALGARMAYMWCPAGIIDSRLAKAVNPVLGDNASARNWATITKLHELAGKSGG